MIGIDVGPENLITVITDLGLKLKAKVVLPRPKGSMEEVLSGTVHPPIDERIKRLR